MHDQPANAVVPFAPNIMYRLINDMIACVAAAQSGGGSAMIGLPVSIRLKLANSSNGMRIFLLIGFHRFLLYFMTHCIFTARPSKTLK